MKEAANSYWSTQKEYPLKNYRAPSYSLGTKEPKRVQPVRSAPSRYEPSYTETQRSSDDTHLFVPLLHHEYTAPVFDHTPSNYHSDSHSSDYSSSSYDCSSGGDYGGGGGDCGGGVD